MSRLWDKAERLWDKKRRLWDRVVTDVGNDETYMGVINT